MKNTKTNQKNAGAKSLRFLFEIYPLRGGIILFDAPSLFFDDVIDGFGLGWRLRRGRFGWRFFPFCGKIKIDMYAEKAEQKEDD